VPIPLSALSSNERKVKVAWFEDEINIVYRPGMITPENEDQYDEASKTSSGGAIAEMMAKVIVSWDVTEEDRKTPVVPTAAVLRAIPTTLLWRLYNACLVDMRPLALNGLDSAST
jgi:hypothetical protein